MEITKTTFTEKREAIKQQQQVLANGIARAHSDIARINADIVRMTADSNACTGALQMLDQLEQADGKADGAVVPFGKDSKVAQSVAKQLKKTP